jgi:transcriptional regulator with XRE-family HTH domain
VSESSHEYGAIIRAHRKRLRLSLKDFAFRIGMSGAGLGNAERGVTNLSQSSLQSIVLHFRELEGPLRPWLDSDWSPKSNAATGGDDDPFELLCEVRREPSGEWFALWQTSVHNEENLNTEEIDIGWRWRVMRVRNRDISQENPEGGYKWEAQCRVFDNKYILGTYVARDGITRSKGTLYMVVHTSGRFIHGHWVGCNYDHDWAEGLVAFSRSKEDLRARLNEHLEHRPRMPYNKIGE